MRKSALLSFLLIFPFSFFCKYVCAQVDSQEVSAKQDTTGLYKQRDLIDVWKFIIRTKKHPRIRKPNINGPFVTIFPAPGYSIATGWIATLPVKLSFYSDKKAKGRLSYFDSNFQYTQHNQVLAFCLSNLYFHHDQWAFIGDWRYFKFPTFTYGLGSSSLQGAEDRIDYSHVRFYQLVMRQLRSNLLLGLGYHLDYRWNISDNGTVNIDAVDYLRYGFTKKSVSSGLSANFIYDSRDNAFNSSKGFYFNLQFRTNLKALGGDGNWNSLVLDVRKYIRLPTKWYTELAFWGYAWLTLSGKPPYLDLPSTGWDTNNNMGRGYGTGRFRGLNLLYLETEFRFNITPNGLLGGVVFANAQTVSDYPGNYFGAIQPGVGAGIRIKFNKHTNTNAALDYGFGNRDNRGFATNLNEVF